MSQQEITSELQNSLSFFITIFCKIRFMYNLESHFFCLEWAIWSALLWRYLLLQTHWIVMYLSWDWFKDLTISFAMLRILIHVGDVDQYKIFLLWIDGYKMPLANSFKFFSKSILEGTFSFYKDFFYKNLPHTVALAFEIALTVLVGFS